MNRGPLAPLDGVPGVTGVVVRAGVVALVQTLGMVGLALGLAHGLAAAVDGRSPLAALALAAAGALVRAAAARSGPGGPTGTPGAARTRCARSCWTG